MAYSYAQAEREWWLRVKAHGKKQFFLHQFLEILFAWLLILIVLSTRDSFQLAVLLGLLPILFLWGYLRGRWRWKDLEKKYPD
jgi:hypothetical protein